MNFWPLLWLCLSSRLLRDVDGKRRYLLKLNFLNISSSSLSVFLLLVRSARFLPLQIQSDPLRPLCIFLVVFCFIRSTLVTLAAKKRKRGDYWNPKQQRAPINTSFKCKFFMATNPFIHRQRAHPVGEWKVTKIASDRQEKAVALLTLEINWIPALLQFLCCRKQSVANVQLFVHRTLSITNRAAQMHSSEWKIIENSTGSEKTFTLRLNYCPGHVSGPSPHSSIITIAHFIINLSSATEKSIIKHEQRERGPADRLK